MMGTALQQESFLSTAKVIVEHSLKLGFERAHLFWAPKLDELTPRVVFVGVQCAGNGTTPYFSDVKFNLPKMQALNQYLQSHNTVFIQKENILGRLEREFKAINFQVPPGGLWILTLWVGSELLGILTLDFGNTRRPLSTHECTLLNFFASQVTVMLELTSKFGYGKWLAHQSLIINNLSEYISRNANNTSANLIEILEEVRQRIGKLIDVSNFLVVLTYDMKTLDFPVIYKDNKPQKKKFKDQISGLEGYIIKNKKNILLHGAKEFVEKEKIDTKETLPLSFLGVSLNLPERSLGAIIIQNFIYEKAFTEYEMDLLESVTNQLASLIQSNSLIAETFNLPNRSLNVFLCHSKEDKEKVRELYNLLVVQPDIKPWFDEEDLLPGIEWDLEIERTVRNADVVIVCLSKKSLTKDGYIHKEIRLALDTAERKPDGTIYIIPLILEECVVPERLSRWQWMDYHNKSENQFDKLMEALRKQVAIRNKEY
jgi:hypothetical protein